MNQRYSQPFGGSTGFSSRSISMASRSCHAFRDTFGVNPAPVFRKIERFDRHS